jgi:hypothetical protein
MYLRIQPEEPQKFKVVHSHTQHVRRHIQYVWVKVHSTTPTHTVRTQMLRHNNKGHMRI